MNDAELAASFSREDSSELCRVYLRGLKYVLKDPSSEFSRTSYRANPLIEKEWVRRGLLKDTCATPDAISAIKSMVENDRVERAARAAAPRTTISAPAQPVVKRTTNCTSTLIGKTVFTNCY